MIVLAFKDLNKTAEDIGKEHNISGHLAMDIFNKYVHPKRHVLPTVISVDAKGFANCYNLYRDMNERNNTNHGDQNFTLFSGSGERRKHDACVGDSSRDATDDFKGAESA